MPVASTYIRKIGDCQFEYGWQYPPTNFRKQSTRYEPIGVETTVANAETKRAALTSPDLLALIKHGRQKLATYASIYQDDKELRELLETWDAVLAKRYPDA